MTREEAIEILQNIAWSVGSVEREQIQTALDMAIEALSADAVSREDTVTLNSPISIQAEMVAVVRCKDCRYLDREDNYCTDGGGLVIGVTENDYCSRAKRREP